jgi:tetratricopeptide (TPR) repeat protein
MIRPCFAGRRTPRRAALALLFALVVGFGGLGGLGVAGARAAQQQGPDAFYLALLRDGKSEMLRGDTIAAKKSFRLACFGFLEQPVILAEGLVRLGLAEAALSDREAFVATFARLAEVEERFAAYAPAALSPEERRSFEEQALEWVTPELLRTLPTFAPLLARKSTVDLSKLSPRDRTRELEKRAAAEPNHPQWKLLLAQEDAAEGRMAKVLSRLEGVPDSAGNEATGASAGCLRGRALADLGRCGEAIAPLAACAASVSDARLAEARLACLVALGRLDAARELAAKIARPASEAPAVRKAIARIPSPPPAARAAESPAPARAAESPAPASAAESPAPARAAESPAPAKTARDEVPAKEKGPVKEEERQAVKPVPTPAPKAAKAPVEAAPAPVTKSAPPSAVPVGSKPAATRLIALSPDEERLVADARTMLKTVENRDELRRGFAILRPVADRLPGRSDLQLLAGEIGYRAGLWSAGAEYFKRSTPGGRGPVDPTQRFYYAVCLYEAGNFAGAAEVASSGLEKLQRPPFVESYLQKIRAARP